MLTPRAVPGIQSVLNKCSPWATPAALHPRDKLWGTAGHSQPGSPLTPSFPSPSLSPSHTLSPSVMPGLPTNLSATKSPRSALSLHLPGLRGGRSVRWLAAATFGMRLVEQGPHGHHSEGESWGDLLRAKQGRTTIPYEPTTSEDERKCSLGSAGSHWPNAHRHHSFSAPRAGTRGDGRGATSHPEKRTRRSSDGRIQAPKVQTGPHTLTTAGTRSFEVTHVPA